ncbi:MAG TPA: CHAP domain-containing protein [Flavobacteriales bacterium]
MRRRLFLPALISLVVAGTFWFLRASDRPATPRVAGTILDSLHGVLVHDNGNMGNVSGRNVVDGYNVGLRYQCVEFVKRYYLEHYHHRMPNSYGHAKDFFDPAVADGARNTARDLLQYTNASATRPAVGDLLVFDGWKGNPYGHVAIISRVEDDAVEVVQQNTGSTRAEFNLDHRDGKWILDSPRILGRLRK